MDMETVYLGLEASLYGLGGVFIVLILFYVITKAMVAIANKYTRNKEE